MNMKEFLLLQGVIGRTRQVMNLDKNAIRRQAKNDALNLLTTDLIATLKHEYASFDEDKFKEVL